VEPLDVEETSMMRDEERQLEEANPLEMIWNLRMNT
jgi:hypothetical protein